MARVLFDMKNTIVITGTPGTGKTRLAAELHKIIKGSVLVNDNEVAKRQGLIIGKGKYGALLVDLRKLEIALNEIARKGKGTVLMEGHLLCEVRVRGAKAIVLREHLKTLKQRLEKRKYGKDKVLENVVAEATDYCGQKAMANYKEVYELLSSDKRTKLIALRIASGAKEKQERIELLEELVKVMKEEGRFSI
ncbi:MAG: AAA family ATPase [Candidatus Micrarchaeia archaeon]